MRATALTALAAAIVVPATALSETSPADESWKEDYQVVKFGILSGENEQDRIMRYASFERYLERELGLEVETFTAGNYDGVIQALAADQIEFAWLGSSSYAAAYTETEGGVEPLLTRIKDDGSTGYYSIIAVKCDSGHESLADLEGKVLAFADPDSTSGYAVPYYNLVNAEGLDPKSYFSATPFSGSHEAGVQGVVQGTFDAAATYQNNETDGVPQRMVDKGMLEEGEVCGIWESPEITSGPFTARGNLPAGLVDAVSEAVVAFPEKDQEGFRTVVSWTADNDNNTAGYVEVDHERYRWIVDMREWLKTQRRSSN